MEHRKPSGGKRSPDNLGLLSYGIARCSCPGGPHALNWRKDKGGRYKTDQKNSDRVGCKPLSMAAGELDAKVWKRVMAVAADPNVLLKQLYEHVAGDTSRDELKAAHTRVRKLEGEKRNLLDSIRTTASAAVRTALEGDLEAVLDRLEAAEAVRTTLAAEAMMAEQWVDQGRSLVAELRALEAGIADLDLAGKRDLLDRLDVKVYVKRADAVLPGEERFDMDIGIRPPTWMDMPPLFPGLDSTPQEPYTWEWLESEEEWERYMDQVDWDAVAEQEFGSTAEPVPPKPKKKVGTGGSGSSSGNLDKNISSSNTVGDEGNSPVGADTESALT